MWSLKNQFHCSVKTVHRLDVIKANAGLSLPSLHCSSPFYSLFIMRKSMYPTATKCMPWVGNIDVWAARKLCTLWPVMNGRAEPNCSLDRHLPVSLDVMPYATLAQSCFENDRSVGFLCRNSVVTSDSWVNSVGRVTGVNCQRKYMKKNTLCYCVLEISCILRAQFSVYL